VNCSCKLLSTRRILDLPAGLRPRFLSRLPKPDLETVLAEATHRRFLTSSVVVHEEDPAERVFVLTSGRGRHFVLTPDGRKIVLHWLTAGQVFGGAAVVSAASRYLASTEVLSESCALVWDRRTMRELMMQFPVLLDNALSIAVTEHIAWLIGARKSLSSDDAPSRIADLLISLACGIGSEGQEGVEIPVGNEDLAAGASVSPFTVSRTLSRWQHEGILRKARGKVILLQPEFLAGQWTYPQISGCEILERVSAAR
jgi:CRP/FNR family transcriptional regulator, nitrogen oxide reductase regulator